MEIALLCAQFYTPVSNGVAEIAESTNFKVCPHTSVYIVYNGLGHLGQSGELQGTMTQRTKNVLKNVFRGVPGTNRELNKMTQLPKKDLKMFSGTSPGQTRN
jgi:hypothetical protein